MFGTIFYPLSRVITAAIVFFSSIFSGAGFSAAIGQAPPSLQPMLYPRWVHEHWAWENDGTDESIMGFIQELQENDIPVGVIILDRPWEIGIGVDVEAGKTDNTAGSFIPCPVRYPSFYAEWEARQRGETYEGFMHHFHSQGIKVTLWGSCMVNTNAPNHAEGVEKGYFLNDGRVIRWWGGDGSMIDYTNPEAVEWWEAQLDNVLELGIDGWKLDGADPYVMLMMPGYGQSGLLGWKQYQKLQYEHYYNYTRSYGGVMLARSVDGVIGYGIPLTFASRDINFVSWVGDQDADWGGMRAALANMFTASLFNYVSFGSDIGGFRSGPADNPNPWDTWIRWAQLGAMSPVMEMESTVRNPGDPHRPFAFNDMFPELLGEYDIDIVGIYRDAVRLHTELIPYFASQTMYSYERRQPLMRPTLGYYQYKLGDELFVVPIMAQGDETGNERTIIFPAGDEWIYLFDETQTFRGGSRQQLHFSYEEFPVYIRKGAILPMEGIGEDFTTVRIYPKTGSNQFGLYEQDVEGTMLSYTTNGSGLTIKSGETARSLLFRVYGEPAPASVKLGGTALAPTASLAELKTMDAPGWFVDADGVLWIAVPDATAGAEIAVDY